MAPPQPQIPIGERIKKRRQKLGLGQGELATRVGIKQPSLSDIESGRSKPRSATLLALARELQDDFDEAWITEYLARRGSSSWDQMMRPLLHAVRENDLLLDLLVFRLARVSERFRLMLSKSVYRDVERRANDLLEILVTDVGGEVGGFEAADMILAPIVAHIGPPEMEQNSDVDYVREGEAERPVRSRKRKTG